MRKHGDEPNINYPHNIFQIEFDTHVARSLRVVTKELPSIEEKVANVTGNHEVPIPLIEPCLLIYLCVYVCMSRKVNSILMKCVSINLIDDGLLKKKGGLAFYGLFLRFGYYGRGWKGRGRYDNYQVCLVYITSLS